LLAGGHAGLFTGGPWCLIDIHNGRKQFADLVLFDDFMGRSRMKREKLDDLYQVLTEQSLQGIVVYQQRRLVYANDATGRYLQMPVDALLGSAYEDLVAMIHPEQRDQVVQALQGLLTGEVTDAACDVQILDGRNQYRWLECLATAIDYRGSPAVLICFCDITLRKEAEERFRALFERAPDSMFIYSIPDRGLVEVNEEFCINLGYPREELLQLNPANIFASKNGSSILKRIHSRRRKRKLVVETDYYRKDGTLFPAEVSVQWIEYQHKPCVFAVSRDIAFRRRQQRLLEKSREQYRELSIHLQNVKEEQNAFIAREIHDDLGQSLTALKMHLSMLQKQEDSERQKRQEMIAEMQSILDDTVGRIRKLSRDLWPSQLDISGILEALEVQFAEFRQYSGVDVVYNPPDEEISLPGDKALAVYRIVQETLTNVVRHADASRVHVEVYTQPGLLHVILKDNGRGMKTLQRDKKLAFGLLSMKERAAIFEGSLRITSSKGRGTNLHLKMPISK